MKSLSVVIPVYNEENNVIPLYQSLKRNLRFIKNYEIIFVNDGSTDNTFDNLKRLKNKVRIINLAENKGLSYALKEGFAATKGSVIVTLDGDLQNDPSDIPKLLTGLKSYDAVCGWRYNRNDPFFTKKLPSWIFNLLIALLFNMDIHDSSCTLRVYKSSAAKSLGSLKDGDHRFIPVLLSMKGFKIGESKVKHNARVYGKAKYNSPLRFIQGLKSALRIMFRGCAP